MEKNEVMKDFGKILEAKKRAERMMLVSCQINKFRVTTKSVT